MESQKTSVVNQNPSLHLASPSRYIPWYRKKIVLFFASVIIIVAMGAIYKVYQKSREYLYVDNALVDGDKMSVAARSPGKIVKLLAEEGNVVHKGQLLARLDDSELDAQKRQTQASVLCVEQNVWLCASTLDKIDGDLNRASIQFKNGSISTEQYEHVKKEREAAEIQKAVAVAQVVSARAQLNIIETQLEAIELYAPKDGVVAKKWVSEGDQVQPGSPVYTIFNLSEVSVVANVEETRFRGIHPGQEAIVSVDAYPGIDFRGKVASAGPCAAAVFSQAPITNSTGEFTKLTQYIPIRIALDGIAKNSIAGSTPLMPGMSVEVRLKVGDRL